MPESSGLLAYFGLWEHPFAPTADPVFFYAADTHGELLRRLWLHVDYREGLAVVTGAAGSGKTMIQRKMAAAMMSDPDRYACAVVGDATSSWSGGEVLARVAAQFGLSATAAEPAKTLNALNQWLLSNRSRTCTLFIDDAQTLSRRGHLEALRLLQRLETGPHKLLNILCFAREDWAGVLDTAPEFTALASWMVEIPSISRADAEGLVNFRLSAAGAHPPMSVQFTAEAITAAHAWANGLPRPLVNACRSALVEAHGRDTRRISAEIMLYALSADARYNVHGRTRVAAALTGLDKQNAAEPAPRTQSTMISSEAPVGASARERRAAELLIRAARRRGQG